MTFIRTVSIAAAAITLIGSAALAQEAKTGMVTQIDRLNGTIAIQQPQDGTVGASTGSGSVKQFKVQGVSLDALHAGDQVSFTQSGDTITRIERKK
ncbi:MAG: copper-binding protein [Bradyrhizobium sp.]|nr:copper-binding protein [Bradyrhizobium sp.]